MLKLRIPIPVFRSASEIVNGKNARMALKGLVVNRAALIISKSFLQSIYLDQVQRLINSQSVKVIEKKWEGEPTLSSLSELIGELEDYKPDYIIALGGGSVIDGAKLAWLFYEHPVTASEKLFRPFAFPPLRGRAKFAAIPTTVGSGSEVSSAAVLFDADNHSKKAVVTHDFLPDLVILDPELITEVPVSVLRPTVADALSHAIEGYLSQINHPLMDIFAEKAVQLIFENKRKFGSDAWDIKMIEDLQYASMLAGWVQNHCIVGLSHAIAHQLGHYKIGHGLANGVLMPAVIDFNSSDNKVESKYQNLCDKSGIPDIKALKGLFYELVSDLKPSWVFNEEQLTAISETALLDPGAKVNPVPFCKDDVKSIIRRCL